MIECVEDFDQREKKNHIIIVFPLQIITYIELVVRNFRGRFQTSPSDKRFRRTIHRHISPLRIPRPVPIIPAHHRSWACMHK